MSGSRLKQASEQEAPVLDVRFTETRHRVSKERTDGLR